MFINSINPEITSALSLPMFSSDSDATCLLLLFPPFHVLPVALPLVLLLLVQLVALLLVLLLLAQLVVPLPVRL